MDCPAEWGLYDDTFRQSVCSVAWKSPRLVRYLRDQPGPAGTLFVDGNVFDTRLVRATPGRRVAWLHEPPCLWGLDPPADVPPVAANFDIVLTYQAELLALGDPYRFMPYGGVWIEEEHWSVPAKTKGVSLLVGTKVSAEGHRVRRAAAEALVGQVDLYGALGQPTNYSMATKRLIAAGYRFTVVTETCRQDNLFTEITLDPLVMGCVPVLWGCPNIGDHFDPGGIIQWSSVAELRAILPTLTPERYAGMLPAIQRNFGQAQRYAVPDEVLAAI